MSIHHHEFDSVWKNSALIATEEKPGLYSSFHLGGLLETPRYSLEGKTSFFNPFDLLVDVVVKSTNPNCIINFQCNVLPKLLVNKSAKFSVEAMA